MTEKELLAFIRENFYYNPDTGLLWRKFKTVSKLISCKEDSYLTVGICGKVYKAYRIMWLWYYGSLPKIIDHKNRNINDNRISNLRAATKQTNSANSKVKPGKFKGVRWNEQTQNWRAEIRYNGKTIYLGLFENSEDAAKAYNDAAIKYFGEYACVNEL